MRVVQPVGVKGSLKWIQRAVNANTLVVDRPILQQLPPARHIEWLSPRLDDDYSEYRDGALLDLLGLSALRGSATEFWPLRGPQWDAVGRTEKGQILLVEAKAHVPEMLSSATQAKGKSLAMIEAALSATADAMGANPKAPWSTTFYQLANRFAALHFLRTKGVDVYLVLANFVGDKEMGGPLTEEGWRGAYSAAFYTMGLTSRHCYSGRVIEIFPSVQQLG